LGGAKQAVSTGIPSTDDHSVCTIETPRLTTPSPSYSKSAWRDPRQVFRVNEACNNYPWTVASALKHGYKRKTYNHSRTSSVCLLVPRVPLLALAEQDACCRYIYDAMVSSGIGSWFPLLNTTAGRRHILIWSCKCKGFLMFRFNTRYLRDLKVTAIVCLPG
jgi:hypothetical protein